MSIIKKCYLETEITRHCSRSRDIRKLKCAAGGVPVFQNELHTFIESRIAFKNTLHMKEMYSLYE